MSSSIVRMQPRLAPEDAAFASRQPLSPPDSPVARSRGAAEHFASSSPPRCAVDECIPKVVFISAIVIVVLSAVAIYQLWDEAGARFTAFPSALERAAGRRKLLAELRDVETDIDSQREALAGFVERRSLRHHTIFVSIAAFRDALCDTTVRFLFRDAVNPRRVFVGAVEQNEPGDPTCVPDRFFDECRVMAGGGGGAHLLSDSAHRYYEYDVADAQQLQRTFFCPLDNIRRRRLVTRQGKGPTFGRYVSMLMYRDESYVMSIDSHNRFRPEWDRLMLAMLLLADSPKPVLSHYPLGWNEKQTDFSSPPYVTVMCRAHSVPFGYVRMGGLNFPNSRRPRRQPWTAAGFLAADAAMIHEVPFDPHLDYLFDGEELLYTARLWTHGWDSFAPSSNLVFHRYDRMSGGRPAWRFWSIPGLSWAPRQQVSVRRVQWMLRVPKSRSDQLMVPLDTNETEVIAEAAKYGLGTARPLEKLWEYAKLDLRIKSDQPGVCHRYFGSS